jgi:group I intron endonuclease
MIIRIKPNLVNLKNADAPFVVYKATNVFNGDFYIGVTQQNLSVRVSAHYHAARRGEGTRFYRAIRKYGESSFTWKIIASLSSRKEMFEKEIQLIAEMFPSYNSTTGGDGQFSHNAETRKKISDSKKGKKPSENTIKGLRKFLLNRTDKHIVLPLGPLAQQKKIICLNDKKVFSCAKEAAAYYKISRTEIGRNCRNELKVLDKKIFKYFGAHLPVDEYQTQFLLMQDFQDNLFKTAKTAHPRQIVCENDQNLFGTIKDCATYYGISEATVLNRCLGRFEAKSNLSFSYLDEWCANSL